MVLKRRPNVGATEWSGMLKVVQVELGCELDVGQFVHMSQCILGPNLGHLCVIMFSSWFWASVNRSPLYVVWSHGLDWPSKIVPKSEFLHLMKSA